MNYFKYLKIMLLLKQIKTPITDDNNRVVQNICHSNIDWLCYFIVENLPKVLGPQISQSKEMGKLKKNFLWWLN